MKKSLGAKTLLPSTPVLLVGSYDEAGQPNLMNVGWGGLCCSDPPCIAISVRPSRQSHANIERHRAFTVHIASIAHMREADYVGIYSGRDEDKLAALGLTAVRSELVHAPVVDQFPLALECKLVHSILLGSHTQFIGQILDVKAEEAACGESGNLELAKIDEFLFSPIDYGYYRLGEKAGQAFSVGRK